MSFLNKIFKSHVRFFPAVHKKFSCGDVIEYAIYDSATDSYFRHRIRLKRLLKGRNREECKIIIAQLMNTTNEWLAKKYAGLAFSPARPRKSASNSNRCNIPLTDVLTIYMEERSKELKKSTCHSYIAFCKQMKAYLKTHLLHCTADEFDQLEAVKYMEMVLAGGHSNGKINGTRRYRTDNVTPRTYNNNLKIAQAFWNWAIEKCYATKNPFKPIKKKVVGPKFRQIITIEDRRLIYDYFQEHRPEMCIIMQLVYVSLLRPVEITRVRVGQINFEFHCIDMQNIQTKNGRARMGRIDPSLEALLREHIAGADLDDYLFADKTWKCGKEPMSSHTFANEWQKMRNELKLPLNLQLYSLKDSGINNMMKAGINALDTMQAAGHSDLSMTTRYADHPDADLMKKLNENAPTLV